MNLLHIVSEQSLQNLLPLAALRPARVIQIRSADERFARAATHLRAALVLLACEHRAKLDDVVAFARALGLAVYIGNPAEGQPLLAAPDLPDHLHWNRPDACQAIAPTRSAPA